MFFRRLALLLVVVALVGCNNEKNRNLIDRRTDQAEMMGEQAREPGPRKSYDPLVVSDKVWSGNKSIRLQRGVPLPGKYETARGVALISSEPMSLSTIAGAITSQTGIPVRFASNMEDGASSPGPSDADAGVSNGMSLAYEGPLSGLLDMITGNYGLNWKYDGVTIRVSRYETRVFVIEALPGTQAIKDGMKDDSSSGSGGSSSTSNGGGSYSVGSTSSLQQSSEMSVEFKVWDELNQSLTNILGGVGTVVLSPSSGTATVTTTPELMAVVAKFLEEENRRLSKQIAINVEIYAVSLEDNMDFDVAFATALKNLSSAFGANISGATGTISTETLPQAGQLSMAILNPERTGQIGYLFSALSTVGDATRVTQFPMTTLNNRTVSRRVGRDRTYVAEVENSDSTSTSFSSSKITAGTIREGFSLQLTPRVLEDGRVLMQYSFSLVDIVNLKDFDTGIGVVQLPETASRVFVQQAMLNSGATLLIGGYDDEQLAQSSAGVGNPYNYFFGGGSTNSKTRTMLFIAISPQVVDVPVAEKF